MFRVRSRMRSMLMRASARARGPPGQECTPRPKAMCDWAFSRSRRNSAGHSKRRGSRLAAPLRSITGVPAAMSTPATVVDRVVRRKSVFTGLSMRSASSMKLGILSLCSRSSSWSSGCRARCRMRVGEEPGGGLLAGGEQEGGGAHDGGDLGRGAVGVGGEGQVGEHVLAGRRRDGPRGSRRSSRRARPAGSAARRAGCRRRPRRRPCSGRSPRGTAGAPSRAPRGGRRRPAWRRAARRR